MDSYSFYTGRVNQASYLYNNNNDMLFIFHVMSNKIKRLQKYNSVQSKVVLNLATIIHIKESYLHIQLFFICLFKSLVRKANGLFCNLEFLAFTSLNLGFCCLVCCFLPDDLNQDWNFSCFRAFFAKLRQSLILPC